MNDRLSHIIATPELHARWLNTLSYLENCGARKIARAEHPTLVKEDMLKHASEEFRHAYHFKQQINRVPHAPLSDYSSSNMLGGIFSLHYMNALDLACSRLLRSHFSGRELKHAAYLLVTYAIEVRALDLYAVYDKLLKIAKSRVIIRSVLLEEQEHLHEIESELHQFPAIATFCPQVRTIEGLLYSTWCRELQQLPLKISLSNE